MIGSMEIGTGKMLPKLHTRVRFPSPAPKSCEQKQILKTGRASFGAPSSCEHIGLKPTRSGRFGTESPGKVPEDVREAFPAIHFVGFRGDEYGRACRVFGRPDFIHRGWDKRAQREIDFDRDTILFATGEHDQEPRTKSYDDIREVAS